MPVDVQLTPTGWWGLAMIAVGLLWLVSLWVKPLLAVSGIAIGHVRGFIERRRGTVGDEATPDDVPVSSDAPAPAGYLHHAQRIVEAVPDCCPDSVLVKYLVEGMTVAQVLDCEVQRLAHGQPPREQQP